MPRTLADRLQSHAQQKARLAEREMLLKEAERKARTRRLIEAGGLVEKAGLLALDANALYGLLLSAKGSAEDPDTLAHWIALGGRAFARETRAEDEVREAVVVSFPAPVARGVAAALRAAGLRFNRLRAEWEGRAEFDKAATIAKDHGGTVRRVGTASIATAAQ
ncbi:MAG TPA: conjugal transfer protein TraD [Xanthobacteraceae bacterium]|nr:conjugal transfer protein TraD [Xanthobacteraceae bacterium]